METLKDFFQSIMDSYKDRIKSPLIGSFILTYLIFNWRAVAVLFYSDWPVHCRIEWIDDKYCNPENYLWPLAISLFYVLALPYVNIFFEWVLKNYSDRRKERTKKIRKEDLELKKEEAKLLREIADAQAGISEINELKERNNSLTIELNSLTSQNNEDLERHRLAFEDYKNREKEHNLEIEKLKRENKSLRKEKNREIRNREFLKFTIHSNEIVEAVLDLDENTSAEEKLEFLELANKITGTYLITLSPFIEKLADLGIIKYSKFDNRNNVYLNLTPVGDVFATYLKNGFDVL